MKKNIALLILFFCAAAVAEESAAEQVAQEAQALEASVPAPVEAVAEAVVQAAPAPAPEAIAKAVSEPTEFHLGVRAGLGFSQFRGHVALITPNGYHAFKLQPSLAASAGLITQIGINKMISIAPELQWSLYRASAELETKSSGVAYDDRAALMGVYLHALELPVLARFSFGSAYGEIGPQAGFNLYSRIYKNANYYRPDINRLALGVVAGGGIELSGILLGARAHFGLLEYAKDTKGIPWNFELGIGKFFF